MALTQIVVDSFSPRGGPPGTQVTISGSGFQSATGQVVFDPLGQAVAAAITSWDPQTVVFTVPSLPSPLVNRFIVVELRVASGDDSAARLWWSPATAFAGVPTHPSLDYQLPFLEEGPDQDADDPKTISAADFNRLLGMAATLLPPTGAAGGDLSGTYPNPAVATVGGVAAATIASAVASLAAHLVDTANPHDTSFANLLGGTIAQLNLLITDAAVDAAGTPRPPLAHVATHANGGGDALNVAGLSGLLADPQTALAHAASHQNGGGDAINVGGLSGLLASPQTPLAHATSHQHGGSDEIATDVPAPNAIPKADGAGTLDAWVTPAAGYTDLEAALAAQVYA